MKDQDSFDRFNDLQRKLNEGIGRASETVDDFINGESESELDQYFMPVMEEKRRPGRPKKVVQEQKISIDTQEILKRIDESIGNRDKYVAARRNRTGNSPKTQK